MPQRGAAMLDGDAIVEQVFKDKTFFSNDALTKRTGTMDLTELTVADFQANAGAGDCVNPDDVNDNLIANFASFQDAKFSEVDLGGHYKFKQYRHYGLASMNGDGELKLQYHDGTSWVDWATITTRVASWCTWIGLSEVLGKKIRIVGTAVIDSGGGGFNKVGEVEVMW